MSGFTPSLVFSFNVGARSCSVDDLRDVLDSICENTAANRDSITLSHFTSAVEQYAEDHIKEKEPEGMCCGEFAQLVASNFFKDTNKVPYEPQLRTCCEMFRETYGGDLNKYIFKPLLPRFLGIVLCCATPSDEDMRYCDELRGHIKNVYRGAMPNTTLIIAVSREGALASVRDVYEKICSLMDDDPGATFKHEEAFFCVMNHPCPLHPNFLYIMKREMMRSMVRCMFTGAVCCRDHTKTSMGLIAYPLSTTVIKGKRLDFFFESPFYRQVVGSRVRMWDSALSQFVAFYKTDAEYEMVDFQPMLILPWPYAEKDKAAMLGRDSADEYIDFNIRNGRYTKVERYIQHPENVALVAPMEQPELASIAESKTVTVPARLESIPQTCSRILPAHLKPPTTPMAVYSRPPCNLPFDTKFKYFVLLQEAVLLDCLSSFSPAPDQLCSPALIISKVAPPKEIVELAFKFVSYTQRWGISACISPLKYNTDKGDPISDGPGCAGVDGLLRGGNAEAGLQRPSAEGCGGTGGDYAGGGVAGGTDDCGGTETPV